MYCPYCMGNKMDWVKLECPECGASEENGYIPERRKLLEDGSTVIRTGEGIYFVQSPEMCGRLQIDKEEGERLWKEASQ